MKPKKVAELARKKILLLFLDAGISVLIITWISRYPTNQTLLKLLDSLKYPNTSKNDSHELGAPFYQASFSHAILTKSFSARQYWYQGIGKGWEKQEEKMLLIIFFFKGSSFFLAAFSSAHAEGAQELPESLT